MNVLIAADMDASNLFMENVVRGLISRGHHIEVYAKMMDSKSIRMFTAMGLPVQAEEKLTNNVISKFDIAFCAAVVLQKLRCADIYIFVYNHMLGTWATEGGDFMFTMVRDRYLRRIEDCAIMPIGIAKNDTPRTQIAPKKQILFIDAGHYPFGAKGKYQVANMLLDICHRFPDYELVVKPRWLLTDSNQSHVSRIHLYNILQELTDHQIPDNLILLQEHRDLQELIDESVSVVTTSVSCYFDAVLRGKGCIVVDGLDSEKQYGTWHAFEIQFEDARRAGCCVDYRKVADFLPAGIHCNQEYFYKQVPYIEGVSSRIVDVIEYVYDKFIRQNKYPAIRQYDFETYRDEMESTPPVSFQELKQRRIKNAALSEARIFEFVQADLDYGGYYQRLNETYRACPTTVGGISSFLREQTLLRWEVFIKNRDAMMADAIDQSFLLRALYSTGREEEILEMEEDKIRCTGPYHYFLGLIYNQRGQISTAIDHFCLFLKEANARPFTKYWEEERSMGICQAYDVVFTKYDGWNISAAEFADLCYAALEQRPATDTSYGSRKCAHHWLPQVAEQLVDCDPERALRCLQLYAKYEYHYNIRERENKIAALTNELDKLHAAKLYRLKEKMKWFFRKVKGGIKCYRENGWEYTIHRAKEHIESFLKDVSPYRLLDVFNHQVLDGFRTYSEMIDQYGENAFIHVAASGNGDVYLALKYYQPYIEAYFPDKNNVFVSSSSAVLSLCDWFSAQNARQISLQQLLNLIRLYVFTSNVRLDILHHHIYVRHTGLLTQLEGINGLNFMEMLKAVVFDGLAPVNPERRESDDELNTVFEKKGLIERKTVVLAPYANNVSRVSDAYWLKLAQALTDMGVTVCTNATFEQPPIAGTVKIELPLYAMNDFLDKAGHLVALRSGFVDVTQDSTCKKVEVYPRNLYKRSLVASTAECFAYVDRPIIVGADNIGACVNETLAQLGLMEGKNSNESA